MSSPFLLPLFCGEEDALSVVACCKSKTGSAAKCTLSFFPTLLFTHHPGREKEALFLWVGWRASTRAVPLSGQRWAIENWQNSPIYICLIVHFSQKRCDVFIQRKKKTGF